MYKSVADGKNCNDIKTNIQNILQSSTHLQNGDVKLVAVSKFQSLEKVMEAIATGHRLFGENRVQEAVGKWTDIKEQYADIQLHLIGPLQTNKVRDAVRLFDVIESVDRAKLADQLLLEVAKAQKKIEVYVQVNIGREPQKAGLDPEEVDDFVNEYKKKGLLITGLMCIPPAGVDPESFFKSLKDMAGRNNLPNVSMGMSADYKKAIECGATHIRVGTAIFGDRA